MTLDSAETLILSNGLPSSARTDVIAKVSHRTARHTAETNDDARREIAQVFTPPSVARFMAARVESINDNFHFIDAGAGVGMLAAALCERISGVASPHRVHAELYETDPTVTPLLLETMQDCEHLLAAHGHQFSYSIHAEDFVLRRPTKSLFAASDPIGYADAILMNPPYFKLAKESPQARAFPEVVHGQPNIYSLFMAAAVELLKPGGDLVAITPRSFCNGLYFREFRRWLLARMSLRHIHLFESRRATFKDAEVLQESIITVATKQTHQSQSVMVSCSRGTLVSAGEAQAHNADRIIDNSSRDCVIRLPSAATDLNIMRVVESWPKTFAERGLRISTGPVVSFRATKFLLASANHADAVPLLSMHNIRPFLTVWPLAKGTKPIAFRACDAAASLLLPSQNYLLMRRFSAKEEHRRLTASAYVPTTSEREKPIALENHLNYITHRERELSENEVHGLAAVFNSAFFDQYFRILSGSTQVNATEIRTMPFPNLATIGRIGAQTESIGANDRNAVDAIVLSELGIDPSAFIVESESAA